MNTYTIAAPISFNTLRNVRIEPFVIDDTQTVSVHHIAHHFVIWFDLLRNSSDINS